MEKLFIDESGSMTVQHSDKNPYFVISIVRVKNPKQLKKVFSRFVSKYLNDLRECDRGKAMFNGDAFKELKGSALTPELKRSFINYFCRNDYFEVFYIVADNRRILPRLYKSTARAFNYLLKLALEYFIKCGYITSDKLDIQIDERNEKTFSRHFLLEYINTELFNTGVINDECCVQYFDSANNKLIQMADVLANIYYSYLITGNYENEIQKMKREGYLKFVFEFPKQ